MRWGGPGQAEKMCEVLNRCWGQRRFKGGFTKGKGSMILMRLENHD